jgi:putative membrane protein
MPNRIGSIGRIFVLFVLIVSVPGIVPAAEPPASFLNHAALGQQQEIELGQLAVQKGGNEQVKQFGARMIQDHQKAKQEVQQLASAEGVRLASRPNESDQKLKAQLEKLSGKDFDHAYMTAMLREHAQELRELEEHAIVEKNHKIREWAAGAVPLVKEHLGKAATIASSLGIPPELHTK